MNCPYLLDENDNFVRENSYWYRTNSKVDQWPVDG